MPFVPSYQSGKPTVGGSQDTWGNTNNDRIDEAYADFQQVATVLNATEATANDALPKSGGTLTGDVAIANVAPAGISSVGYRGAPVRTVTVSGNLLGTDAGLTVRATGATAITVTVPLNIYQVGNFTIFRNASSQPMTIARASGVQIRVNGSSVDKNIIIAPWGTFSMIQEAPNVWYGDGKGAA